MVGTSNKSVPVAWPLTENSQTKMGEVHQSVVCFYLWEWISFPLHLPSGYLT